MGLFEQFIQLDKDTNTSRETIIKAPFGWPGGKSRSVKNILPLLPYSKMYVEPFGGSAAILLSRYPSKLEVYNDRFAGVVAFYQCMRSQQLYQSLIDWLDLAPHSREEFLNCRDTWKDFDDPVERAARWYYMTNYSFSGLGRNFGRTLRPSSIVAPIYKKFTLFPAIHARFRNVQIENADWRRIIEDYDNPEAVFYIDPPYLETQCGTYKHNMTHDDHIQLLTMISQMKGFVALSGYPNPLYEEYDWDERHEWESFISLSPRAFNKSNNKEHLKHVDKRIHAKEVLWIKYT